jgi:ribosomal protein S18 acetylase RimI-like enzyme
MATIRPATIHDMPGAYRVGLLTGDAGQDSSAMYRDPDLIGHLYVGPYLVGEPDLALVVADEAGVAGYCLAATDTRRFEAWTEAEWWPALREHYPPIDDGSPDAELIREIHASRPASEAVVAAYPAHLHIDLLERVRGAGFGRALIERQLGQLRERGIPGVHLDVDQRNANAIAFYRHLGFVDVEVADSAYVMAVPLT